MNCPVDVGVMIFIKVPYGVDYLFRFLRGCSIIKIDERVVVYFSF